MAPKLNAGARVTCLADHGYMRWPLGYSDVTVGVFERLIVLTLKSLNSEAAPDVIVNLSEMIQRGTAAVICQ